MSDPASPRLSSGEFLRGVVRRRESGAMSAGGPLLRQPSQRAGRSQRCCPASATTRLRRRISKRRAAVRLRPSPAPAGCKRNTEARRRIMSGCIRRPGKSCGSLVQLLGRGMNRSELRVEVNPSTCLAWWLSRQRYLLSETISKRSNRKASGASRQSWNIRTASSQLV